MQAIRDIVELKSAHLAYDLPKSFPIGKIELIILPLDEPDKISPKKNRSIRGILGKYANQSLKKLEKKAWLSSVAEKVDHAYN